MYYIQQLLQQRVSSKKFSPLDYQQTEHSAMFPPFLAVFLSLPRGRAATFLVKFAHFAAFSV